MMLSSRHQRQAHFLVAIWNSKSNIYGWSEVQKKLCHSLRPLLARCRCSKPCASHRLLFLMGLLISTGITWVPRQISLFLQHRLAVSFVGRLYRESLMIPDFLSVRWHESRFDKMQ